MATIRELFHSLGNKYNLITVGCGATQEITEECLGEEALSEKLKDKLPEILKNLESLIKNAQEADKITNEIRERIYKIINPDTAELK